jgi:hemerythrin superfamily protein
MDALELLKDDHRKVRSLFDEAQAAESFKQRRRAFESIKYELESHAYIEEGVFYPTFRKDDDFTEILKRSFEEHQMIKKLLQELDSMGLHIGRAGEAQFEERMLVLREAVEAHIKEEESRFFSMVRKAMKPAERDSLGRLMQATRDELEWAA